MCLIEGEKMVNEAIASGLKIDSIFIYEGVNILQQNNHVNLVTTSEMAQITALANPSPALAVLPVWQGSFDHSAMVDKKVLLLDGLRDPGNIGTIIRTAEWFGVEYVVLSEDCADLYNPKTLQASMGSVFRLKVSHKNLVNLISDVKRHSPDYPVFCAMLNGDAPERLQKLEFGMLVIGSEAHGVSAEVVACSSGAISIPGKGDAESLNAAVAAAILLYEWA